MGCAAQGCAIRPVMWNSGAIATVTSSGPRRYHRNQTSLLWATPRWVIVLP